MLKVSFSTMATPELDGKQAIMLAKEHRFHGVDLRVSERKGELTEDSPARDIRELKKIFEGEGIASSSLFGYNKQASDEPESWQVMLDSVRRHLDIAVELGTDLVRINPGNPEKSKDPEGFLDKLAQAISGVLEKDGTSVSLGFQNHNQTSPRALALVKLAQTINNPRFGLVFCPATSYAKGDDLNEVFAKVKPVTLQLYIADGKKDESGKLEDLLPGKGDVPLKEAYQAVGGEEFTGWITFKFEKIWVDTLDDYTVSLPAYKEFLDKSLNIQL